MTSKFPTHSRIAGTLVLPLIAAVGAIAQDTLGQEKAFIEHSADQMYYAILLLVGALASGGAVFFWVRTRARSANVEAPAEKPRSTYVSNESFDLTSDTESLAGLMQKKKKMVPPVSPPPIQMGRKQQRAAAAKGEEDSLDAKLFQEKMRRMQYAQLPINSFTQLAPARKFDPLPDSEDPSLLTAIEQVNEEFEEDETMRELSLRILTAFKTRNSVEALAQIAVYDLSSNLRAKAVSTLADFDHESVFEPIVLACADPTREVRAAAARALFKLNFDRAHAWKRLIETGDRYRMAHAARAAIESGIVVKSFERLINEDAKVAYEAFVLVCMLIVARETNEIFDAIKNHKDERVKFGLLHVMKVCRDESALERLNELRMQSSFPTDISDRMRDVVASFETVAA